MRQVTVTEHLLLHQKKSPAATGTFTHLLNDLILAAKLINRSVSQTLSRTILTSGTTLIVVAALLFFGGGMIHDFALVMFIGVIVGTYSSIFVASPIILLFGNTVVAQAEAARLEREDAAKKERGRGRAMS